jgi:hypothetical protein
MSQQLGQLATGELVFDRQHGSHFATHADANRELPALVAEALGRVVGGEGFIALHVDLGREVGLTACVLADDSDAVVYAQRPNRFDLTRFVRNRQAEPTRFISVVLKQTRAGYELVTAWVGELAPPEPWDRNSKPESLGFWSSHALVWGMEEVLPGTEASVSPW